MSTRRATTLLVVLTALYVAVLLVADSRRHVFDQALSLAWALPALMLLWCLSCLLRYLRWYWLLRRAGHHLPFRAGLLPYVAGLAFTATPGKVGELLRIRYFAPLGVPADRVLGAFVFERCFDLVSVLMLATLVARRFEVFGAAMGFVVLVVAAVVLTAVWPRPLARVAAWLRRARLRLLSKAAHLVARGLAALRVWMRAPDIAVALLLGLLAWGVQAGSFVWLLDRLNVSLPPDTTVGIYALALLAGAASMVPGGIGSTEVSLVALLAFTEVPVATATVAAIAIRLATLWFAMACGLLALALLERKRAPLAH